MNVKRFYNFNKTSVGQNNVDIEPNTVFEQQDVSTSTSWTFE